MIIDQRDIARLEDNDVKRLALIAHDVATKGGPFEPFWRGFSHACIRALRERRRALGILEQGLIDAEDEGRVGSLVVPGSDPVAEAAAELREAVRRSAGVFAPGEGGGLS